MRPLVEPLARAAEQLDDPVFLGVLVRSLAWALACFAALGIIAVRLIDDWSGLSGWVATIAGALGGVAAALLALWLFLPVAAVIGTLYIDRIAAAVERRFYPALARPAGAPLAAQAWDGLAVGARILLFNILALVPALLLPGLGLILAWAIAAYAIGRGLFVAVAMRRMERPAAEALYRTWRPVVLAQGAVLALAAYVPLFNLLIPVLGTAVMVHVLDHALEREAARAILPGTGADWRRG
jgi:uncharacterized protein involved in cysteine biosynthesis